MDNSQNSNYADIKDILETLKNDYIKMWEKKDPAIPITERDIVSEIYNRLKDYCKEKGLHVHTEVKPKLDDNITTNKKGLPIIDVVILENKDEESWLDAATRIQDRYDKGFIEARFSLIPVKYFNTAIEVKIQSKIDDTKKDIDKLSKLKQYNRTCNTFFVLLNARGKRIDHDNIVKKANEKQIDIIEYTENLSANRKKQGGRIMKKTGTSKPRSINKEIGQLIDTINKTFIDKYNLSHTYLSELAQHKYKLPDQDSAKKVFMIIQLFSKKEIIRIHVVQKQYRIENLLKNFNLDFTINTSKLNSEDQFKTAIDLECINIDDNYKNALIDLLSEITSEAKGSSISIK